MISLEEC